MSKYEEKSRMSYDQKAEEYDNTFDGRFTEKFKQMLLEEIVVEPGSSILDVACGNGTLLYRLSRIHEFQGYGIDISEKMIEKAREKCPEMTFVAGACEHIPYPDEKFDIMTVCAAYHHFPDVKAFARETARLLKSEGSIYIAEVYYSALVRAILNPFVPLSKAGDVKFYGPKEIQSYFETQGFESVGLKTMGHVQVIHMKKL